MKHHTKDKGDLGVLKAQLDLFEKGYTILLPYTEHAECIDGWLPSSDCKSDA